MNLRARGDAPDESGWGEDEGTLSVIILRLNNAIAGIK
jgi:hypothetical protein